MGNELSISSAAVSDRGLSEKRPQNEDSYLDMARSGIFAVADGVGGAQAGEVASQMAMEILGEAFANYDGKSDAESVMRSAIEKANAAIHQMSEELPQLANMATTVVALHLADNIATIGHVGDSRLYRVDGKGLLHRETDDHSIVAEEVRAGRLTEEEAENHPNKNIICRALGAEPTVEVDLKTIMIDGGTSFLICSDGVTRHVSDPEIQGVLAFGGEPTEICEYIKGLCYERGAEDNLTAVVIKTAGEAARHELGDTIRIDDDEPTVARTRTFSAAKTMPLDDDDIILELGNAEPAVKAAAASSHHSKPAFGEETLSLSEKETFEVGEDTFSMEDHDELSLGDATIPIIETEEQLPPATEPQLPVIVPATEPQISVAPEPPKTYSMFENSVVEENEAPSSIARIATAAGMLILGALIGLGVYHFALAPKPAENLPITEMKTDNIPFSAYEKLRRNVDADPAAFLKDIAPPDDAADYYLRGRANLLTGDAAKAKSDFTEAQTRLNKADEANVKVLATDIATGLVIASDPALVAKLTEQMTPKSPGPASSANASAKPSSR